MPKAPEHLFAVKSVGIPDSEPWIARFADHTFFDFKRGSESRWERMEVLDGRCCVLHHPISSDMARADRRWGEDVEVLELVEGDEARRMIEQAVAASEAWEHDNEYRAWPGPNSNTYAAMVIRGTSGLSVELEHNAVGADYDGIVAVQVTTPGYGLQLDCAVLGLQLGLKEGVEVHFLGLTTGVSFWPPAIKLPILPRLGF